MYVPGKRQLLLLACAGLALGSVLIGAGCSPPPPPDSQYVDCGAGEPYGDEPVGRPDPDPCPGQAYRESDGRCLDCLEASLEYLRQVMDRYHGERFWVYEDADSAGNHFLVWASFTKEGESRGCPIVIHGDTRNGIAGEPVSCVDSVDSATHVKWHRYTAPADGEATLSLCGSAFDTVLSIHQGCPGSEHEVEIACDDDTCGQQSTLTVSVQRGESYLVRIAGKDDGAGPYTLTIDGPADPDAEANLNCDVSVEFDGLATRIDDDATDDEVPSGATAIEFRLNYSSIEDFGGLVMNNGVFPESGDLGPNYGTEPGGGVELTGVTALKFLARGELGGEQVEFFVGGIGWDGQQRDAQYPGSTPAIKCRVTLTTDWREYVLPLEDVDLSSVIGGFGWAANAEGDPDSGSTESDDALVFYVDDIYFELNEDAAKRRLQETPRFLQSFTPRPLQGVSDPVVEDFDHRFRSVAFVYDNALALLAFLAEGTEDGLARARLIGDAFIHAAAHDRTLDSGVLRSAYSAGELTLPPGWTPNGIVDEVRLAGFFNPECQEFQALFTDNISVGNTAWAMISLLGLYERTGESKYLDAGRKLGEFIQDFRDDTCVNEAGQRIGGFSGGLSDIEGDDPQSEPFSSAEHNIDVYAAFKLMYEFTGEEEWLQGAEHAKRYVWSLWEGERGCFFAGKDLDCNINDTAGQLPVDVQAWVVLGIPDVLQEFPDVLQCALDHHETECDASEGEVLWGFDFNDDLDGVWFEGTAHVATAYAFSGQLEQADELRSILCRAQTELPGSPLRQELPAPFDDVIGLVAGCDDGISTGFDFTVHKRLHIAATAWNVFAQASFNPYLQDSRLARSRAPHGSNTDD